MKLTVTFARVFGLLVLGFVVSISADRPLIAQAKSRAAEAPGAAARGEYLATRVAMCVQCHSGRDSHGEIIEGQKFRGGAIPFDSPYPGKEFASQAPNLAGLTGLTDDQVVTLLMTGVAPGRRAPRAPMPPFRMERSDAESIVAFLRTR